MGAFHSALEADYLECKKKAELVDLYKQQIAEYQRKADERDHYFISLHTLQARIVSLIRDKAILDELFEPDCLGRPLI
jgi:hypothetical protein